MLPINEQKALTDIIDAIGRLNFRQLCILQAGLAQRILDFVAASELKREKDNVQH